MTRYALLALALVFPRLATGQVGDFDPEAFDAVVERAASDWNATGLAVAVVAGEELLFARLPPR